jgi:tRNA(His) guanylyltransferase
MSRDSLGDRMKRYERVYNGDAMRRTPLMIRVDGRAFHTFTANFDKPFDAELMSAMELAAREVASEMQGFKAAYIQSDEATFCLTDYDTIDTQPWFDYDLFKVVSISASLMTIHFNNIIRGYRPGMTELPVFDARAFSLPKEEVVNAFLWRAKDWERNSVAMYCQSFFSHKQMHGQGRADQHEMLHSIGKNWATDLGARERNGAFLINDIDPDNPERHKIMSRHDILPNYPDIEAALGHLFAEPNAKIEHEPN